MDHMHVFRKGALAVDQQFPGIKNDIDLTDHDDDEFIHSDLIRLDNLFRL